MTPNRFPKLRGPDGMLSRVQDNVDLVLGPVAKALGATPIMGAAAPAWVPLVILSPLWAQLALPEAQGAVHKDALGYVWTKGTYSSAAGDPSGTTVVQYPVGYRPKERLRVMAPSNGLVYLLMEPDGSVITGLAVPAGGSISLSGLTFLAEG